MFDPKCFSVYSKGFDEKESFLFSFQRYENDNVSNIELLFYNVLQYMFYNVPCIIRGFDYKENLSFFFFGEFVITIWLCNYSYKWTNERRKNLFRNRYVQDLK